MQHNSDLKLATFAEAMDAICLRDPLVTLREELKHYATLTDWRAPLHCLTFLRNNLPRLNGAEGRFTRHLKQMCEEHLARNPLPEIDELEGLALNNVERLKHISQHLAVQVPLYRMLPLPITYARGRYLLTPSEFYLKRWDFARRGAVNAPETLSDEAFQWQLHEIQFAKEVAQMTLGRHHADYILFSAGGKKIKAVAELKGFKAFGASGDLAIAQARQYGNNLMKDPAFAAMCSSHIVLIAFACGLTENHLQCKMRLGVMKCSPSTQFYIIAKQNITACQKVNDSNGIDPSFIHMRAILRYVIYRSRFYD